MSTPDGGREPQGQWSQDYTPEQAAIAQDPRNGMGIAGLVFGILALLTCFWVPILGLVLGILAIIFAVVGRGRVKRLQANNGGVAVSGLVLGIISVIVNIILTIFVFVVGIAFINFGGSNAVQQAQQCLSQAGQQPNPAAVQQAVEQCQQQFSQQLPGGGQ